MDICSRFRCKAFASVVSKVSPMPAPDHLRKDYAYLFERFFYYLEDLGPAYGIVVFDELDKVQSHLFLDQMDRYFKLTSRGRHRSGQILPEPLFVQRRTERAGAKSAPIAAPKRQRGRRQPELCSLELCLHPRSEIERGARRGNKPSRSCGRTRGEEGKIKRQCSANATKPPSSLYQLNPRLIKSLGGQTIPTVSGRGL